MRTVEFVIHCWRFSRVLNYLLSSLILYPPQRVKPLVTVFYNPGDEPTAKVLSYFCHHATFAEAGTIFPWKLELPELQNRTIGRNMAAKATGADIVWFADADYVFGEGCLDALAILPLDREPLFFPRHIRQNTTRALGDAYARAADGAGVYDIVPKDFGDRKKLSFAVGGVQIVPGDVARKHGYCDGQSRLLQPTDGVQWRATREDIAFRKSLGTSCGTAVNLPNLYRIRQTVPGAVDTLVTA